MFARIFIKALGDFWAVRNRSQTVRNTHVRNFYKAVLRFFLYEAGSYIGEGASFAGPPVFPHGLHGIFISGGASIGKNCVIFQQVTIGSNTLPDSKGKGAPCIGDSCYIGAGAKIVGNVRIGNNCRIGANCVVFEDMPDNSVAVLQRPNIIKRQRLMDNRFYSRRNGAQIYYEDGKVIPVTDNENRELLEFERI